MLKSLSRSFAWVGGLLLVGTIALGALGGTQADQTTLRERTLAHEELIADCMAKGGFSYIAAVPADVLLEEARAAAEAADLDVKAAIEAVDLPPNPNDSIVAELSPEEQEAYAEAYWGNETIDGCYDTTYEEAWGVSLEALLPSESTLAAVEQAIEADPRVIAAQRAYIECMAKGGYNFDSVYDIVTYRARQTEAVIDLINGADGGSDVDADNPVWVDFEKQIAHFEQVWSSCEAPYLDTIDPIRTTYMAQMREELASQP